MPSSYVHIWTLLGTAAPHCLMLRLWFHAFSNDIISILRNRDNRAEQCADIRGHHDQDPPHSLMRSIHCSMCCYCHHCLHNQFCRDNLLLLAAAKSFGSAFLLNAHCPSLGPGWLQSVYTEKGVNNAQVAAFNWMGNWLHGSCGEERWSIGTWNSEVSAEWYKHADQVLLWGTLLLLWFPNRH